MACEDAKLGHEPHDGHFATLWLVYWRLRPLLAYDLNGAAQNLGQVTRGSLERLFHVNVT